MIEYDAAIFAWFLCYFEPPSSALVDFYEGRGVRCHYIMRFG